MGDLNRYRFGHGPWGIEGGSHCCVGKYKGMDEAVVENVCKTYGLRDRAGP